MSLEHELVYELRRKGSTEADVLQIVDHMGDPEVLGATPVKLNPRLVRVALSQYQAKKVLKKRKDYAKSNRERLKELIEQKEAEIRDTTENLLSLKMRVQRGVIEDVEKGYAACPNCRMGWDTYVQHIARITYLNEKGGIPTPVTVEKRLVNYCTNCGYTKELI